MLAEIIQFYIYNQHLLPTNLSYSPRIIYNTSQSPKLTTLRLAVEDRGECFLHSWHHVHGHCLQSELGRDGRRGEKAEEVGMGGGGRVGRRKGEEERWG